MKLKFPFCIIVLFISCNHKSNSTTYYNLPSIAINANNGMNNFAKIKNIPLPNGYKRIENKSNDFATYLREINLKKNNTVYLYNGEKKPNQTAQFAVLDITVGNRDLQQCADAVMRLRAEFLFENKRYAEIVFIDNEAGKYLFTQPYTYSHFTKYLNKVFGMCGSASLSKQLKIVSNFAAIKSGDVLIKGGFPGHAVIVVDVAKNNEGKKIYLIAQSYMPAQNIHVLNNPNNSGLSPWYEVNDEDILHTPEYVFYKNQLKEW